MNRMLESEVMADAEECRAYRDLAAKHSACMDRPFVRRVRRLCLGGERILDVGTGPGFIPMLLAESGLGLKITAVDLSEEMLVLARREAERRGISDAIRFEPANARELPYESRSFDLVLCHSVLHHFSDPVPVLNEMNRVLRPGGRLVVKDLIRPPAWMIPLCVRLFGGALRYTPKEKAIYAESLRAALSARELVEALERSDLRGAMVRRRSMTHHLTVCLEKYARPTFQACPDDRRLGQADPCTAA